MRLPHNNQRKAVLLREHGFVGGSAGGVTVVEGTRAEDRVDDVADAVSAQDVTKNHQGKRMSYTMLR